MYIATLGAVIKAQDFGMCAEVDSHSEVVEHIPTSF